MSGDHSHLHFPITSEPKPQLVITSENEKHAYDNPAFEQQPRSRKVSTEHTDAAIKKKLLAARKESSSGSLPPVTGHETPRSRRLSIASEFADPGPVRRKSILHIALTETQDGKLAFSDASSRKMSLASSVHSRARLPDPDDDSSKTWWYTFCVKCRGENPHPAWYPPIWPKLCPYPFCPTYRQISRLVALVLIGALTWLTLYSIVGDTAAPGGTLFTFAALSLAAYIGGWIFSFTTLPALIGMLFTGFILQNAGAINITDSYKHLAQECRHLALVIILIRAGLDIDPNAFKRLKFTVIKLGVGPWMAEAGMVTVLGHFLIKLPWGYSMLLGTIIAAVSPAVVVPCLFRLRAKGYGVAKGIPTLIIAVSGIGDALSVAICGILLSILFSEDSLTSHILQGPISIFGGIAFGVAWGVICKYTPEKHDPFVVPLRILLLGVGGLISVFGSELIGYGGAGPLACVSAAFVSLIFWSQQGWDVEDNPAATAFEILWDIFQPIVFGITGAQIKIKELEPDVVGIGIGVLILGCTFRIFVTVILGIGSRLNIKEKFFVALAWMSKATVQAALGPTIIGAVKPKSLLKLRDDDDNDSDDDEEYNNHKIYANKIVAICVISIMVTAPLGAILMSITGSKLLTKVKLPEVPEGWRRSHRPSIRDISIIDEDEDEEKDLSAVKVGEEINKGELVT